MVANCAESIYAMLVAVALPRKVATAARPGAPGAGSKFAPAPSFRFRPARNASAPSVMVGFPLLVHQPLLSAPPSPRQTLPKSTLLLPPVVALSFPSQHLVGSAVAVPPLVAPESGPVCLNPPTGTTSQDWNVFAPFGGSGENSD